MVVHGGVLSRVDASVDKMLRDDVARAKLVAVRAAKLVTWIAMIEKVVTYFSPMLQHELHLRLMSFIGTGCGFAKTLLQWPKLSFMALALHAYRFLRAGFHTWKVYLASRPVAFSDRELALYKSRFEPSGFSQREYYELLRAGAEWHSWAPGQPRCELTTEGEASQKLILLTSGSCSVVAGGQEVASVSAGALVGEGSFARHLDSERATLSTATVVALDGPVEYLAWPVKLLEQHVAKNAHAKACLMTIIAHDLADKLDRTDHQAALHFRAGSACLSSVTQNR